MKTVYFYFILFLGLLANLDANAQCQLPAAGWYTDQAIDAAGCNGESFSAPYEAWEHEMYFSVVQASATYTFSLTGCSQTAWGSPVEITVWEGSTSGGPGSATLTGGTVIANVTNTCNATFTASVSDTVFFIVNGEGNCGNPLNMTDNGVPTITTISGVSCACGDAFCDSPVESYCNCDQDCDCTGGGAAFVDMFPNPALSPNPVVYCPTTLGDTVNSVPFRVFVPIAPFSGASLPTCITGWNIATSEGSLLRSTALPTALSPTDTVNELTIFYLSVTDADIAAAVGGVTTITFTDATGPGTCTFTFDVDWNGVIVDDDGNPWAGSADGECGCSPPSATIVDYDCNTNTLTFNVSDVGLPSAGSPGFTWAVEDGSATPIIITDTGNYSFVLDNNLRSWDIIASDSVNDDCNVGFFRVYPDCRMVCSGGTDLLLEGGFDSIPAIAWDEISESQSGPTGNAVINFINPVFGALEGPSAAIMGGLGLTDGSDTLYRTQISQVVSISSGSAAALHLWGWLLACDSKEDVFTVEVNGDILLTIEGDDVRCEDGNWYEYSLDLSAYAGGTDDTITLTLSEFEVNGGTTVFFVDEMVLEECGDCPPLLSLSGISAGDFSYYADTIITNQTVQSPDSINYIAQDEVNLDNDFEAQLGSIVVAYIDDCVVVRPIVSSPTSRRSNSAMLPTGKKVATSRIHISSNDWNKINKTKILEKNLQKKYISKQVRKE